MRPAVDVADRLVDEVEVERVELQAPHRTLERSARLVVAGVVDPEFRGEEDLLARHAAALDGVPNRLLVAIGRRRIEKAVADAERRADRALALGEVGDLKDAEPEERHLDSVVERDGRNS